jgi:hypothetical protein
VKAALIISDIAIGSDGLHQLSQKLLCLLS